jgi:hypothetical protein
MTVNYEMGTMWEEVVAAMFQHLPTWRNQWKVEKI